MDVPMEAHSVKFVQANQFFDLNQACDSESSLHILPPGYRRLGVRHLKCARVGRKQHKLAIVVHFVKSSPDRPIIRSETSKHEFLNRLNMSYHHGNKDWTYDSGNTPVFEPN